MKELETQVQINEEETGKLPEKEFRIMIVKMIKNLDDKMKKMQDSVNRDLEELKNKPTETNNKITEIKNTLEIINSRISEAEEQISELEDKMVEITSEEQNKVNRMKELRIVSETSGTTSNAQTFKLWGVPEEEEKKKGYEKTFEEIIVENFPNMEKEIVNPVQEVQRVPYRINPRRNMPRYIIIKLTKTKY